MQKVKREEVPKDLNCFFDSVVLETKRTGFCSTGLLLVNAYLESNDLPQTMAFLSAKAKQYELSSVRVDGKIVFRKLMLPMQDVTEVQRASGEVICDICKFEYRSHPEDTPPNEFLKVLCNGRRVKL